jgi:hypothetical protein
MEVQVHEGSVFTMQLLSKLFDEGNLRILITICNQKLSIKVLPCCTCPRIADYHAIRIDHRNDEEVDSSSQLDRIFVGTVEELDESFKHKGTVGLPWMHSSCHQDVLLIFRSLWVSYMQDRYIDARERLPKDADFSILSGQQGNFMHKFTESIRYAIGKEDLIILVLKLILKFQAVIAILGKLLRQILIPQLLLVQS